MSNQISKDILIHSERIQDARHLIRDYIYQTNVLQFEEEGIPGNIFFKMENQQHTGSFKARGSLHKILLEKERGAKHVITASTGNHALGVARALSIAKMDGQIVLPQNASKAKIEKLKKYPVELTFVNGTSLEVELHANALAKEKQSVWISPYNDPEIIAGQGTIGIELLEQCKSLDAVCITVGGGGLISGVSTWLKSVQPDIVIIGCQPKNSAEMYESVKADQIVDVPYQPTLSDGSAGGIEPNAITFPMCQSLINEFSLIDERDIEMAIRWMHQQYGEKIEGAAGVAVASALQKKGQFENIAAIICGGNIEEQIFNSIVNEQ